MITNTLKWKHVSLALLLSLATLISACGGDSNPPPAADTLYYVHTDHLGTPQVITDADQKTVWEGRALPFGETDIITNDIAFNVRFPGQYYDQESGLHYNYYRDYDPALGRYVQSDPIGLAGGLNTYGYAYQNPIMYTDPTGLFVPIIIGGIIITGDMIVALGTIGVGVTGLLCINGMICDVPNHQLNEEDTGEGESCPSNDPDNWEKIKGSNGAYRPKGGKEPIFEKDRAGDRGHGGSEWKKWDKKRDWEKGKDRDGTYDGAGNRLRD